MNQRDQADPGCCSARSNMSREVRIKGHLASMLELIREFQSITGRPATGINRFAGETLEVDHTPDENDSNTAAAIRTERAYATRDLADSFRRLCERIRDGDARGEYELRKLFSNGLRLLVTRELGMNHPRLIDDIFTEICHEVRQGHVREPERLPSYVRTILKRQTAGERRNPPCVMTAPRDLPNNRVEAMRATLSSLPPDEREILRRFYVHEQTATQIRADMKLIEEEFRLKKKRAYEQVASGQNPTSSL